MAMLRLFTTQGCNVLWKCSHFAASCVTKKQVGSFLPVKSASYHRLAILARLLSTDSPEGKEAPQTKIDKSEEMGTLDLDGWKSVMRSQGAVEEKQVTDEAEECGDGEHLTEPGGGLQDSSPLEATRRLVAMWQLAGRSVPQDMTDEEVETLAQLTTKSSKKKYLKHLAVKENYKLARKVKQQKRDESRALKENSSAEDEDDQKRQEPQNTFLLHYRNQSLDKLLAWRSAESMVFGQPLVFDMSYESNMCRRDLVNTVSQLLLVEAINRRATEPFHLHFCNLQPDGGYMKELQNQYGAEVWERMIITSTDSQHVDVFPREQLVYLTADSPNILHKFDHSKVYIVGAVVDRSIQSGLSLAHAKRLNLATARLPLDQFLQWEVGAKNLTLNQMISIMLTMKDTGKWNEALKFVPQRKHAGPHEMNSYRARGFTNQEPRDNGDRLLRSGERDSERTFKRQSHYPSRKESGFNSKDRMTDRASDRGNTAAVTKVRTSPHNALTRKTTGKYRV